MRIEQFSQDLRVPRPFIYIRKQLIGDLYPLRVGFGANAHPVLGVTPLR